MTPHIFPSDFILIDGLLWDHELRTSGCPGHDRHLAVPAWRSEIGGRSAALQANHRCGSEVGSAEMDWGEGGAKVFGDGLFRVI